MRSNIHIHQLVDKLSGNLQMQTKHRKQLAQISHPFHGSYYCAEFIFPDFSGQNKLFSLTDLFMRNNNVSFQSLAITLATRVMEQI